MKTKRKRKKNKIIVVKIWTLITIKEKVKVEALKMSNRSMMIFKIFCMIQMKLGQMV